MDKPPRALRTLRVPPVVVAALLLLPLVLVLIVVGAGTAPVRNLGQGHWFANAIHSPLFVRCGVVTLLCLGMLAMLLGLLWVAGRRARSARKAPPGADTRGGMIIEFVMVLPIALMLILVMTQSSMLMGGNLCVNYAAYCAARSAIVTLPLKVSEEEASNAYLGPGSQKHLMIKQAAVWAVMPVSCSTYTGSADQTMVARSVESAMDNFFRQSGKPVPQWVHRRLVNQFNYADKYTEIGLKPSINTLDNTRYRPFNREDTFKDKYNDADHKPLLKTEDYRPEDITVDVRHTFYLAVPYGNMLFAKLDRRDGVELQDLGGNEFSHYGMNIYATCTLTNEGAQDWVDTELFPRFRGVD